MGRLIRKVRTRLILSVDLISRAVSVEVDAADVGPSLTCGRLKASATMKTARQLDSPFVVARWPVTGAGGFVSWSRPGAAGSSSRRWCRRKAGPRHDRTLSTLIPKKTRFVRFSAVSREDGRRRPDRQAWARTSSTSTAARCRDREANAGCSLMREPRTPPPIGAMARAVRIPVTVKMRAG